MVSLIDKLPPQCLEAERYILGAIMQNPNVLRDLTAILVTDHFYRDDHRMIFQAMCDLYDKSQPSDGLAVSIELDRRDELKRIGGDEALSDLYNAAPHTCDTIYHAEIVRRKAVLRELIDSCDQIRRDAFRSDADAEAVIANAESRIYALANLASAERPASMEEVIADARNRIEARQGGELAGVPTGFHDLDDILGGCLTNGEVTILAARPSMGKTALCLGVCEHVSVTMSTPSLLVSLEMGKGEIGERMLSAHSKVDGGKLKRPWQLDESAWSRLDDSSAILKRRPLWVDDASTRTMAQIVAIARREKAHRKIGLLSCDYLQLIDGLGDGERGRSRQEEVSKISRRFKMLAKELDIPVLLLSQLNRECESRPDKRPILADLRESGAIEQDADVVLLLHRPDRFDPNDKPGMAELIVAKNRNGATGVIDLTFLKNQARFASHVPEVVKAPEVAERDRAFCQEDQRCP